MPDLRPDLSVFSKPQQQMSIGDILGAANQIGEIEGKRSLSDAILQSTHPETKEIDFEKAMGIWGASPGFKHPGDAITLQQGAQAQMTTRAIRQKGIAEIFARAAADPNMSPDEIRALVVSTYGPGSAAVADKYLHGANKSNWRQRLTSFGAVYNTFPAMKEVETRTGTQMIPEVVYQQQANEGIGGPSGPAGDPNEVGGGVRVPGGMQVPNEANLKPWKDQQAEAVNYPRDENAFEQAHHAVFALGPKGMGPPNEAKNELLAFAQNMHWIDDASDQAKQVQNYQIAKKNLERLITTQGGAAGFKSNDQMFQVMSGNPNTSMQQATVLEMLKVGLSLRRMQQVGFAEYNKMMDQDRTGLNVVPGKFANWYSQWAPKQDFRAFSADSMTKAERKKLIKDVGDNKAAQARYLASHKAGERAGVFNPDFPWHPGAD